MAKLPFKSLRTIITILTMFAALTVGISSSPAQQRGQCFKESRQICDGIRRPALRQCIKENFASFSEKCQQQLRDRARRTSNENRRTARRQPSSDNRPVTTKVSEILNFGDNPRQTIGLYLDQSSGNAPIIVFIHGGGWQAGNRSRVQSKPGWFNNLGFAFGSVGYRLHPEVEVEQQATDIASAISALRKDADRLKIDANRIVLIGHSAGAHLAALIATNPAYLGDDFTAIQGVILLDGAAYDIPATLNDTDQAGQRHRLFESVFSNDPDRQAALSPVTYAKSHNAPHWLALYVANRPISKTQSENLVALLQSAGTNAMIEAVTNTDHGGLNRRLGTGELAADAIITAFLQKITS